MHNQVASTDTKAEEFLTNCGEDAKLFEGKMHTRRQCKTISNGLSGFGAQKNLDRVVSGDFRANKNVNLETEKSRIP